MSKKNDEPLESFPAGKRTDPDQPHDPNGWIVERRTERPTEDHVGKHRDDGYPLGRRNP